MMPIVSSFQMHIEHPKQNVILIVTNSRKHTVSVRLNS